MIFKFSFPVKTNANGPHHHPRAAAAMRKRVKDAVAKMAALDLKGRMACHLPIIEVVYTRYSVQKMDDDNLAHALKPVRDAVCGAFGVDDGSVLYAHRYRQMAARALVSQVDVDVEVKCVTCKATASIEGTSRVERLAAKLADALEEMREVLGQK